ncbi:hypothetical protein [Nitrosopumilus adriaticus]|nr:hypothetical protein [Nitrosopumilus adriaticus]
MTTNETQFFSRTFDDSDKILLIGSSHVGMLDSEEIEKIINENHSEEFEIYNLAKGSDTPTKRLKHFSQIHSLKPILVVYGLGFRDFAGITPINNEYPLPNPENFIKNSFYFEADFLQNPKLTTLNVIRNIVGVTPSHATSMTSTPFFPYSERHSNIMYLEDIGIFYKNNAEVTKIPEPENNLQLQSLIFLLNQFENNNIDVILFITPHNSEYLETLNDVDKKNFENIIEFIENKYDIHVNSLLTNYTKSEIWSSPNHIVHGPKGFIFNQDIAKMIIEET